MKTMPAIEHVTPQFHKVLAKYYIGWFQDCHDSMIFCRARGDEKTARKYRDDASKYLTIIMENWEAIEFFSHGSRAFLQDHALPEQWRGYK